MKDPLSKKDLKNVYSLNNWKERNRSGNGYIRTLDEIEKTTRRSQSLQFGESESQWSDFHDAYLPVNITRSLFDNSEKNPSIQGKENLNDKKISKVLELSPAMIIIMDRWGLIEYANPMLLKTVGYSRNEVLGRGPGFLSSDIHATGKLYELQEAIMNGTTWKGELIKRKRNGDKFIFSASLSPVENAMGLITNFIIVGQDVTPFRETQEELKKALEEKNVLLSELHHRVKNNLAVVSGLMQFQAYNEKDEKVQNKLYSSAGRIKAMSTMHELLYKSKSLSRIKLDTVIEKVVQHVSDTYKKKSIKLKWNLECVKMNINQAHPCTLIFYEVISNAYKHAFKTRDGGIISINLYTRGDMTFILVRDNGKGSTADFNKLAREKSTTGYELMTSLIDQLDGQFTYESDMFGTSFFMQFMKEDYKGISNANM